MNENTAPLDLSKLSVPSMDAARMLISPPPEEELQRTHVFGFPRTNSATAQQPKRKRPGVQQQASASTPSKPAAEPVETTPNPKPRKSHRRPLAPADSPTRPAFASPQARNPDADWLPPPAPTPARAASRRRSATPQAVPYEPPTDVFVPPREVLLATPTAPSRARTKPRRGDSAQRKTSATPLRVVVHSVKKELPPIDLARPMTPPSPTDDPLLLVASSSPVKRSRDAEPSSDADYAPFDWTAGLPDVHDDATSDSMDLDPPASFDGPLPLPNSTFTASAADAVGGGWDSDSDDDADGAVPAFSAPAIPTAAPATTSTVPTTTPPPPSTYTPAPASHAPSNPTSSYPTTGNHTPTTPHPNPGTATGAYTRVLLRTKPDPRRRARRRARPRGASGSPFPGRGRSRGARKKRKKTRRRDARGGRELFARAAEEDVRRRAEEARRGSAGEQREETTTKNKNADDDDDDEEEEEVRRMSVEPDTPFPARAPVWAPTPVRAWAQDRQQEEPRTPMQQSQTQTQRWGQEQTPARFVVQTNAQTQQTHAQTPPTRRAPVVPPRAEWAAADGDVDVDMHMREEREKGEQEASGEDEVLSARGEREPRLSHGARGAREALVPFRGRANASFSASTSDADADADADAQGDQAYQADQAEEEVEVEADDDDGDDDDEDGALAGLVKITSADPRAAARAAAILKQHDYDCFTRLQHKHKAGTRRHSYGGVSKASQAHPVTPAHAGSGRMQDIAVLAAKSRALAKKRDLSAAQEREQEKERKERRASARVVGERVYFPGSPKPVTTAQLLREAEAEVSVSSPGKGRRASMPPPRTRDDEEHEQAQDGQVWGKAEWKALDACFTDERIALAARMGVLPKLKGVDFAPSTPVRRDSSSAFDESTAVMMAPADAVELPAVVARFVGVYGARWDGDEMLQRAEALQRKQRAGHVAPPTPRASLATPAEHTPTRDAFASISTAGKRRPSMEVPDFTPLGRRALPPRVSGARARLPAPIASGAPFSVLPPTPEPVRRRRVPGSLMAPRYSHLLEEAVGVSMGVPASGAEEEEEEVQEDGEGEEQEQEQEQMAPTTPLREREALLAHTAAPAPATIGKRVKGFLFSYLPTLAKSAPPAPRRAPAGPARPRLPLPPPDLLAKPRGPVTTPARPPLPTLIPRRAPPRRLVELQHVAPPPAPEVPRGPRPRTSSGGSVKDLVKNFEALDSARKAAAPEVKRVRSVGDFGRRGGAGTGTGAARPMWRP
ncbi:hypothetical protein FB451DRAFT_1436426 [Mycena latifolia]|nr:hypothetical protein FB451DRAFT_1436426 [Mycena latifolia]